MMSDTVVDIKNVTVKLAGKDVLKDITVNFIKGKVVGFIGPSGAGKTTLIRSIVGRQRIANGSISIYGLPAGSAQLRSRMSYMTQEVSVYPDLTVKENIRYFATMVGIARKEMDRTIDDILKTVDMSQATHQLVSKLSGGQKQRVSLALALIGYPKIVVMDEPTVGLDPVLRERLWKLFHELAAKGMTLIISSHVMDEAERCDDLVLIRDGSLLAHGSPAELCAQTGAHSVEQSFLRLVGEK